MGLRANAKIAGREDVHAFWDIDPQLTDREREVRNMAHRFAAEVLRPASVALDKLAPAEVIAPRSPLWKAMRAAYQMELHTAALPLELGGHALTSRQRYLVAEELGWGGADLAMGLSVAGFPFAFAAASGNTTLLENFVRPFLADRRARLIGCWAMTEPEHGSEHVLIGAPEFRDPGIHPQVRARRDGNQWIISGQKSSWVSNGSIATHALVFVSLDGARGMAGGGMAFVPLDLPGITRGAPHDKLGQRGLNQGAITFEEVRVPATHMLVAGDGYEGVADTILAGRNASMAAIFTGLSRAAFEEALAYTKTRRQAGKSLCEHQLVQAKLFDMFAKVAAARSLSRAAFVHTAEARPPRTEYAIAAKVFCTQAAYEVASVAVQLHGGQGLSKTSLIEKLFRDARTGLIEDGANDVLALTAARKLITPAG